MHFTKGLCEKVPTWTILLLILFTKPEQFFLFLCCFRSNWDRFFFTWFGHATTKKVLLKLTGQNAEGQDVQPSEGKWIGASGAPLRALSSFLVVFSSASECRETELFQCRSFAVLVTKDSSVKSKQGKLSVEMTDKPFVTKWPDLPPHEVFFFGLEDDHSGSAKTTSVQHKST